MQALPLIHPAEQPICCYCGKRHDVDSQSVCYLIKLAAQSESALARLMQR